MEGVVWVSGFWVQDLGVEGFGVRGALLFRGLKMTTYMIPQRA